MSVGLSTCISSPLPLSLSLSFSLTLSLFQSLHFIVSVYHSLSLSLFINFEPFHSSPLHRPPPPPPLSLSLSLLPLVITVPVLLSISFSVWLSIFLYTIHLSFYAFPLSAYLSLPLFFLYSSLSFVYFNYIHAHKMFNKLSAVFFAWYPLSFWWD